MISDILSVTNNLKIKSYPVTKDIEKALNSLDDSFLMSVSKIFGFGENLMDWIKILLHKQEQCVRNGGFSIKYFNLEEGACQGDPVYAYLFILALNILFLPIKNDFSTRGIKVFEYLFSLYGIC